MADKIDALMVFEVDRLEKIVAEMTGVGADGALIQAREIADLALYLAFERCAYKLPGRVPPVRRSDGAGGRHGR